MDSRNSTDLSENRNTVIYGHNMSDGSMFASLHDFRKRQVFYNTMIEIATLDGIYVYKPFSVHDADAYDNYFETNFVSDADFVSFVSQMAAISIYGTDDKWNKN